MSTTRTRFATIGSVLALLALFLMAAPASPAQAANGGASKTTPGGWPGALPGSITVDNSGIDTPAAPPPPAVPPTAPGLACTSASGQCWYNTVYYTVTPPAGEVVNVSVSGAGLSPGIGLEVWDNGGAGAGSGDLLATVRGVFGAGASASFVATGAPVVIGVGATSRRVLTTPTLTVQFNPAPPPDNPAGVTGVSLSSTTPQVGVALTASADVTGTPPVSVSYQWRRDGVAIAGASSSSYTPVAADDGHTLQAAATASNSAGSGSGVSASTSAVTWPPGAPTGLVATPGNGQATIAFTPGPIGGSAISNYQYLLNGVWSPAFAPPVTASPLIIPGLTNGTSYAVALRAINNDGAGATSATVNVTPRTIPTAPTNVTPVAGNGQVVIIWGAPANNGGSAVTRYGASARDLASGSVVVGSCNPTPATGLTCTIGGLANGLPVDIRVQAKNAAGWGAVSAPITVTPTANVPGAPVIDSVTPGNGQATVAFTAGPNGGAAISNYEFSVNNGGAWTVRSPANASSPLVIPGLINGNSYQILIRAVNSQGAGTPSNMLTVSPFTTPAAPTIFSAAPGVAEAWVSFTQGNNGGRAVTNFEYTLDGGVTWTVRNPASTSSPLNITSLPIGSPLQIQIRAVSSAGVGAPSTAVSVTPSAPIPGSKTIPLPLSVATGQGQTPVVTAVNTTGLPFSTDPGRSATSAYQNAWYTWTAPVTGRVGVFNSVCSGDSYVSVYSGPPTGANRIASSDDTGPGVCFATTFLATAGTTYFVAFEPFGTAPTGNLTMTVLSGMMPGAPTGLSATSPAPGTAAVTFTPPAFGTYNELSWGEIAVTNYAYQVDGGAWVTRSPVATTSPLAIAGLPAGTHSIALRAISAQGVSATSAPVNVTVAASTPSAPTALAATPAASSAVITWAPPADIGGAAINRYGVAARNATGTTVGSCNPTPATGLTCTIGGLTNGQQYNIVAQARNAAGWGAIAGPVTVTPRTTPSAPTALAADARPGSALVTWAPPADIGGAAINRYGVAARNAAGTTVGSCNPTPATGLTCTIIGLTNGQPYNIVAQARNAAGWGAIAGPVTVTPGTPGPATNLTAFPGDQSAAIRWELPVNSGGVPVLHSTAMATVAGTTAGACGGPSPVVSCTIGGLTNGQQYDITLTVTWADGQAFSTGPVTVTAGTPTFTGSAGAVPAVLPQGGTTFITSTVTELAGPPATGAIVDVEVWSTGGSPARVAQFFTLDQDFAPGMVRNYNNAWNTTGIPPGIYQVKIGVFPPGWGPVVSWNDNAATIIIEASP
jgi:titin